MQHFRGLACRRNCRTILTTPSALFRTWWRLGCRHQPRAALFALRRSGPLGCSTLAPPEHRPMVDGSHWLYSKRSCRHHGAYRLARSLRAFFTVRGHVQIEEMEDRVKYLGHHYMSTGVCPLSPISRRLCLVTQRNSQ